MEDDKWRGGIVDDKLTYIDPNLSLSTTNSSNSRLSESLDKNGNGKIDLGYNLLTNHIFKNAFGSYKQFENMKIKELLGKNYQDYLVLTKQVEESENEESKMEISPSKVHNNHDENPNFLFFLNE